MTRSALVARPPQNIYLSEENWHVIPPPMPQAQQKLVFTFKQTNRLEHRSHYGPDSLALLTVTLKLWINQKGNLDAAADR